jgi:hypothetical protein
MYPEDAVLTAYLPDPADLDLLRRERWYRIPRQHAPRGLYADYFAFYLGRRFGKARYSIRHYARRRGYELVRRRDLLPHQPHHPRADNLYYKVQFGPLEVLPQPIVSRRWRRLLFAHTTWDRLMAAREIGDLFSRDARFVHRHYALLKELLPDENGAVHDLLLPGGVGEE